MKRNLILLFSFIFITAACGGAGGSGSDSITSIQPAAPGALDPSGGGDDGGGDTASSFVFGGSYQGACMVKAMGLSSASCDSFIEIIHEEGGTTIAFTGTLNVNMGIIKTSSPVSTDPLNIVDGVLVDPDSGQDLGTIDANGFEIVQSNGDFMRFVKTSEDGFDYEGEYQDETYGRVVVAGSLQKIAE